MALGPQAIVKSCRPIIEQAERLIDGVIMRSAGPRVEINLERLGITSVEWDTCLRPKYLAAGWKKAKWVSDRDGDFIHLDATK